MDKSKQSRDHAGSATQRRRSKRIKQSAEAIVSQTSEQTDPHDKEAPKAKPTSVDVSQPEIPEYGADFDDDTSSPVEQDDQMGSVPQPLFDLHHSADNYESSPHDLILTYPSGLSEQFSFGRRIHAREHKYARTISPFEDVIRIIEVISTQLGTNKSEELETKRGILETAFKGRADLAAVHLPPLQTLVQQMCGWKKKIGLQRFDCPLWPELVEHFFDQLHDRCVADVASLLERAGEKSRDSTYGELCPQFLSSLFLETDLASSSIYLDLGSGVGQTCMQASLETQCTSFGIEREVKCHTVAIAQLHQFKVRSTLWGLKHGSVHLRKGDFLTSTFVDELLPKTDVVLVNNLVLGPETDLALQRKMIRLLKKGARVVSTRPVARIPRGKATQKAKARTPASDSSSEDENLSEISGEDANWTWQQKIYDKRSVSWSHKRGLYYISVKK